MKDAIIKFFKDEEGLTTVEYVIAGAVVTVGAAGVFFTIGGQVDQGAQDISAAITASGGTTGGTTGG